MILDISSILSGQKAKEFREFNYELPSDYLQELGIISVSSVEATVEATSEFKDELTLKVSYKLDFCTDCSRCLKPVEKSIEKVIEKVIYLKKSGEEFEDDQAFIKGKNLDVGSIIAQDILLNMSTRVLCDENCRGLCKQCGADLNVTECDCTTDEIDPRLQALQKFFK